MYRCWIKRALDAVMALVILVVLALPMLLVAAITQADSDGSAIFAQTRSGKGRRPFRMLKFRSLSKSVPRDVPSNSLTYAPRTRWQGWIRKASVDELPQLINILKGDMSFVGPRPVICAEQDLINERDRYGANDVLPGLTGWAQVNGRDELDYVTKARLDGEYVQKMSFWFDAKCLCWTFLKVLRQEGVRM